MKKVKLSDKAIFVINRLGFISISDEIYLDLTAALLSADGAISDYEDQATVEEVLFRDLAGEVDFEIWQIDEDGDEIDYEDANKRLINLHNKK
ncbi:MAG: hypothetical protein RBS24_00130 [Bacilli bacterium]|nr:hypothetical protein [Bacilli bacterium]